VKILLVYPPHERETILGFPSDYATRARSDLPPLGLMYLASYLKDRHDISVVDMSAENYRAEDIKKCMDVFQPDLIGISCVITQWIPALNVARAAKKHDPGITIVAGGPNPTSYPHETLSHEDIDYVICGCGQIPFSQLCDCLESGGKVDGIENCLGKQASYVMTKAPGLSSLDNFPFPDRGILPPDLYTVPFCPENPTTSIMSSQGCRYRCSFCASRNDRSWLMRDFEKVADEMQEIAECGIRSVMFQDELFTSDPERVRQLCRALIKRKIDLHWTVKSRVDSIEEWMPDLMKEAGCFNIHFGIESGNDKTLARMRKGTSIAQAEEAVRNVKKAKLSCTGNFMLGYPGEDGRDVYRTIFFAKKLELSISQFIIALDLPGTELYEEAVRSGRRPDIDSYREFTLDPEHTDLSDLFSSDRLDRETLLRLLQEANATTRTLYNPECQGWEAHSMMVVQHD
jgi:anaerobic magnesium-protoporphyrin IX monomethyl ester cyclase